MSNDPRVEALLLSISFLERSLNTLEQEMEKQAEEIRQLKKCLKIDPNILKKVVYNKNKGDKK